jgi:site-specific DNA-methyltransferase (adenine-specific)
MGKKWDYDVPDALIWAECLRVLKPGGHLLAFAGTRTQHRMAVRIEDAGFEIRDMIAWVYGSGFPKSHNLKDEWQGWGTALKPALEPITVARKPFPGTVAANVLAHGTGGLNVDGCRVGTEVIKSNGEGAGGLQKGAKAHGARPYVNGLAHKATPSEHAGRWPANLIHDGSEEVVGLFPVTGASKATPRNNGEFKSVAKGRDLPHVTFGHDDNGGSAARFFYCAKASKRDRDEGNTHPTVKPTDLMRYLCRLVTPPGGVVLDPFMGSGSTGKAAILEGFQFIGIEREAEYVQIAKARIDAARVLL